MNILVLSLRGPSNSYIKGGAREYLRQIGKRWVEKGHSVRILCGLEKDFNGEKLPRHEYVDGIEILRTGDSYIGSLLIIKEYKKYHENWADIILENMLSYPLMVPIYVNKPKLIIVHHLMGNYYFQVATKFKALIGFLAEKTIPIIYKKERFITVSNSTKLDLMYQGIFDNRIEVIPNGVDLQQFKPGSKNSNRLIFFIGKYEDGRKKVEDLIEAFNIVKRDVPETELLIAGPGGKIEQKIKEEIKNQTSIRILGPLNETEKIKLYQNSWIFVNPSIKEGFSLTTIEANACGTPVIAYEINGLDTIKDGVTGIVIKNHNPKELAKAIFYLLTRDDIRYEMEKNALLHARNYSWDKAAEDILKLVKKEIDNQ